MHDGTLKRIESPEELQPGTVIRWVNEDGTIAPFSDTVVLGKCQDASGNSSSFIKLARPFLYATLTETICQGCLTGVERYDAFFSQLQKHYMIVLDSTGKPFIYKKT